MGNDLLCRRGEERNRELEGLLLRLARSGLVHHRRQATGGPVGDGALGADLRLLQLEHAAPRGSRRRRHRDGALPPGAPLVRRSPPPSSRSLALALTPVAVVIFRYNDPDAFLTLLLVLAAWACWRAIETGKTVGLVLAGALVGLAFLTKTLDAFIVVPALGLAYLWCGPPRLARRIGQLGWAAARPARLERMVGGHCRIVAEERAPLHRWQHGQLRAQPDLRLQRLLPDLRLQRRRPRRGWRHHVGHLLGLRRRRRPATHVRQRVGGPDLVAPPGRPRRARGRPVADASAAHAPTADAPGSCSGAARS